MAEAAHKSRLTPGLYTLVWIGLVILTTATFLLAKAPLGRAHLAVALLIAITKSALVVLFFMHMLEHHGTSRVVLVVALIFVLLLMLLTLGDVAFRFPIANPPTSKTAEPYMGRYAPPKYGEPVLTPQGQPHSPGAP